MQSVFRIAAVTVTVAAAAVLVCTPAFAAKPAPWSEIKVGGLTDKDRGEYDVMLVAINGSMDFPDRTLYELPPGAYTFQLASMKRGKSGEMTMQPLVVEIRPCTRYALVANHTDPQPNRSWRATIRAEEPIKSCMKKFGETLSMHDDAAVADP